jgi:rRNA maturation protein Nop10
MAQLVGFLCIRCKDRITNVLDSRFCPKCGSAVHDSYARPVAGSGCPVCGASVAIPEPPPPQPAPIDTETDSYRIALLYWGKKGAVFGLGGGIGGALFFDLVKEGYKGIESIKLIICRILFSVFFCGILWLIFGALRTAMFRRELR